MSGTEPRRTTGATEAGPPVRVGLKLPPPAPPRFSLSFKIFLAAALLILIAIGVYFLWPVRKTDEGGRS